MLNTHALRETRATRLDELKALTAKADFGEADRKRFDELEIEVKVLDADLRRATYLEEAERRAVAEPIEGGPRDLIDLEQRVQVGKAVSEHIAGKLSGAELEYSQEFRSGRKDAIALPVSAFIGSRETRAVTTTTPGAGPGSNLIQTSLGPFIDRLRPKLAVELLGATVLSGLTDNLDLSRHKASGVSGWVAEHTDASGSDPEFDRVSLAPKTVTALYEMSRRMMLQAANLEPILRADLGYLLAQAIDSAAINGSGANTPAGIIPNANVGVVSLGTNGAAISVDVGADLMGLVDDANSTGNVGFLTNTKVKKAAAKLKDSQNRPYSIAEVFKQQPVTFSNQVPANLVKGTSGAVCSAIIYGVWSDLIIAYWSSVDIVVNPYASEVSKKGGSYLHAFLDADVALRHPESFAVVKDAIA